jgi:prepilin-type N-terminal cleavage/methylation domain-containing protein
MRSHYSRQAFTLIEILIVVAISTLFSTLAIIYSGKTRNSVALTVEEAKISQLILQAKQLSIATYNAAGSTSCGFGVSFNFAAKPQTYSIFSYDPNGSPPCPSSAAVATNLTTKGIKQDEEQPYTGSAWNIPVTQGVTLSNNANDSLAAILFYPPDPTTFLSHDGQIFPAALGSQKIYLSTVDGDSSVTLTVDAEGQVNF